MKIVQILPEMNAGGVELCTLELASLLVEMGHESLVISNGGRLVQALEDAGSRHILMPVHRKSPISLGQVIPLRKRLIEEKPDILHIHSRVPGWIAWLAWRSMNPTTRPALVSTMHGFYSVNAYSAIMAKGERVIAVSASIRDHVLKCYPRVLAETIRVVSHGIDPEAYRPDYHPPGDWLDRWSSDFPHLAGKFLLLLPGRITRLKGHQDFFNLVSALRKKGLDVHGLVAGDTHESKRAYLDELHAFAGNLGVADDITFLGHRSDIRDVMAASDLVCSLSQQPESFGRTALEAMALGKPVIGYDCGGVGELLTRLFPLGRVPMGDAPGLVEAATAIIADRPKPSPVGPPYTLRSMSEATFAVYRELSR